MLCYSNGTDNYSGKLSRTGCAFVAAVSGEIGYQLNTLQCEYITNVIYVQDGTVEDFLSSPSAAKLEHLGEDRGKVLVDFLEVSRCVCACVCACVNHVD